VKCELASSTTVTQAACNALERADTVSDTGRNWMNELTPVESHAQSEGHDSTIDERTEHMTQPQQLPQQLQSTTKQPRRRKATSINALEEQSH
jgi:hypothetical protein